MVAVREQIFAAIDAALASVAASYERMPAGDPPTNAATALQIFDGGDSAPDEGREAGTTRKLLTVGVDGYVRGGTGAVAHAAIHELYADAVAAIYSSAALNALVSEIDEGSLTVVAAERSDQRRLAFSFDLLIHYATRRGDPATT